jgi:hypothetical protein
MSATAPPIDPAALAPGRVARAARRVPSGIVSLGPALVAVALAMMVAVLHWKGLDQAAQSYRVLQVRTHGLALWDSGWYGGNYPLGYSLVFPVVGAVVGLPVASAASAAGASWAFDRLVTPAFGRRPLGVWYFAASTILAVSIGQLPFLAGEALGMGALVALTRHRRIVSVVLAVAAASCSPLAAAFTVLACAAWSWHRRDQRRPIGVVAAAAVAVIAGLGLLFPGTGPFPFPWATLAISLSACALLATSVFRATPVLRTAAALYAVASVASFLVPNPVGGNAPRLAATVGIPLVFCLTTAPAHAPFTFFTGTPAWADPARWPVGRWWRPTLLAGCLAALAVWQWAPGLGVVTSPASDPAEAASYYQPVVHQIEARSHGPERVEIPPTREHWEAAWVAPAVPLARGWERQLDIADNPIFYQRGTLDPASYRHWLVANGVSWVALPATALDYAGAGEGGLLRAGEVPGLHLVWSNRDWKLWRVTGSPGLVSGPATLATLAPDDVHLTFSHPGWATLRVRYSSFSAVTDGSACVQPDAAGWTTVKASAPGPVTLGTSVFSHHASVCAPGGA